MGKKDDANDESTFDPCETYPLGIEAQQTAAEFDPSATDPLGTEAQRIAVGTSSTFHDSEIK